MNSMKKFKRKMRLLLMLLLITSISLSTATYAWFSVNRIVYISDLHIKVQAQGGIEISTDGINFKTMITQTDIIEANKTYPTSINQLPLTMEPVSTAKIVKDGKLQMYYGYTENSGNDYILLANQSIEEEGSGEESNGKFMAFDIFLKADNPTQLYLANTSGATYEGTTPGIENSVRYAFLVEGNAQITDNYQVIQGLNNATEDTTYIWEPNFDSHSLNGIGNAASVYGIIVEESGSKQVSYDGLVSNITRNDNVKLNKANATNYPNLFKNVNVDYKTPSNFSEYDNLEVFSLERGITKVRVYIWIEGQDVDCENNSAVGDIYFNFQFTTNPSE